MDNFGVENPPVEVSHEDEKLERKSRSRKRTKKTVLTIAGVILAAVAIVVAWTVLYRRNTVTYGEYELYRYFAGRKLDFTSEVTFAYDGSVKSIAYGEAGEYDDATPYYFVDDEETLLLPQDMELIIPRVRTQNYRIKALTKISSVLAVEDSAAYFTIKDNTKYLETSFLYDGNDLYVFPYAVTLTVGEETYELSALSYVEANYGGDVTIYNKATDEITILEACTDTITAKMGSYKIDLTADILLYGDSETRLLVKNFENFKIYEG